MLQSASVTFRKLYIEHRTEISTRRLKKIYAEIIKKYSKISKSEKKNSVFKLHLKVDRVLQRLMSAERAFHSDGAENEKARREKLDLGIDWSKDTADDERSVRFGL